MGKRLSVATREREDIRELNGVCTHPLTQISMHIVDSKLHRSVLHKEALMFTRLQ